MTGAGDFTLDVDGKQYRVTRDDPVMVISPWQHHCVYGTSGIIQEEVEFVAHSEDTRGGRGSGQAQLDRMFFENWYGYQEDVFQSRSKFDILQVLAVSTVI